MTLSQLVVTPYLNLRFQGTDFALMTPGPAVAASRIEMLLESLTSYPSSFLQRYKTEFGFDLSNRDIIVDDIRTPPCRPSASRSYIGLIFSRCACRNSHVYCMQLASCYTSPLHRSSPPTTCYPRRSFWRERSSAHALIHPVRTASWRARERTCSGDRRPHHSSGGARLPCIRVRGRACCCCNRPLVIFIILGAHSSAVKRACGPGAAVNLQPPIHVHRGANGPYANSPHYQY